MTIDAPRVELLLSEPRAPSMKVIWPRLAAQSDKEGWPAAKFLAVLAEHEVADRGRRRFERPLAEARSRAGKTIAAFDYEVTPMLSKAHIMALAAGDVWLKTGANVLLFGPPGGGKTHLSAAPRACPRRGGLARAVPPHNGPRAAAAGGVPRAGARKDYRQARHLRPADPR